MLGLATLHVRNVPEHLYEALRARAERHGRSIGGETVTILADAMQRPPVENVPGGFRGRFRRARRTLTKPFHRFTGGARLAVSMAQSEAKGLKHGYVGTEHLLLGLLRVEDGLARRALDSLGIEIEDVRERVRSVIGEGADVPAPPVPFTPRAKKVLELSLRESLALGHNYIGTEHVLLGLARENEGVAARILLDLGADAEAIEQAVLSMLERVASDPGHTRPDALDAESATTRAEYRVLALEGEANAWSEQLNAAASEGWQLVELVTAAREHRAVLERHRG